MPTDLDRHFGNTAVSSEDLKSEAIKWVKEDLKLIRNNPLLRIEKEIADRFVKRWMARLNLTDADINDKEKK